MIECMAAFEPKSELRPHAYDPAPLGPYDIEIEITHCGICHSDIHLIDDDWGISEYPLVPGHEVIGIVRQRGSLISEPDLGSRVGVSWQCGSCMQCEWCVAGDEANCPTQVATCVARPGGFARSIRVDGRFAYVIPEPLSSEGAAPLLCGGITVYTPLRNTARPGHRVGVIGIGGLGHLGLRFANAMGCHVTAFSTSPNKREEAKRLGAHEFVVSTDDSAMKAAKQSLDLLLTTVHVDLNWQEWLKLLRPHGTLCFVGASPSAVSIAPMSLIVDDLKVSGSHTGSRHEIREMLGFAARHGIEAQVEVLPLTEVNSALARVRENRARYRMVLAVG